MLGTAVIPRKCSVKKLLGRISRKILKTSYVFSCVFCKTFLNRDVFRTLSMI